MKNDNGVEGEDTQTIKYSDDNYPPIQSLEELMTKEQLAEVLGIKPAKVSLLRWDTPKLPYIRFNRKLYFSKTQVVWWLNRYQREVPDSYYIDRMRRVREGLQIGKYRKPRLKED